VKFIISTKNKPFTTICFNSYFVNLRQRYNKEYIFRFNIYVYIRNIIKLLLTKY